MIFVRTDWIDRPWIYFKRALWSRIASFILELVSVLRKCVFFFSEGEYVTNFVYRGTGCIGTNCSLTKCLCTAGRERNIMGQSKNSSISGRDSGWKCLILLKCWLFGGGWFHICTCIRFFINIFSFRHNPISCFLPSSPIAFFFNYHYLSSFPSQTEWFNRPWRLNKSWWQTRSKQRTRWYRWTKQLHWS